MEDSHLTNLFSPWEDLSKTSESTAEYEARLKKIITHESRLKKIIDDEAKIDYARYKGREEGRKEGLENGRKEAEEEGRKEGLVKGKEEVKVGVARNMLSDGFPLGQVAKYTELPIEQLKEIQSRLES